MKPIMVSIASACFFFLAVTASSPADEPTHDKETKSTVDEIVTIPAEFDKTAAAKEAKAAVEQFLKAWNTGDNATLRKAAHYPLITILPSGEIDVATTPDKFETDFEKMRTKQQWDHSTFDKIEPIDVSRDKVHYNVAWSRHNTSGQRYMWGDVIYIVTKREGRWAVTVRSLLKRQRIQPAIRKTEPAADPEIITFPPDFDHEAVAKESRAALERYLTAWNTGDNATLRKALHSPSITVRLDGEIEISQTPNEFERDFDRLRTRQKWDHSTFDTILPIHVSRDKAHYRVTFSRHDTTGHRYLSGKVIYFVTKVDDRWAVAARSWLGAQVYEKRD